MRAAALAALFVTACGVAPVNWSGPAAPPPRFLYAGAHGVPIAYGSGVCAATGPHTHGYPPVPRAAFVDTADGARETRALTSFDGHHPLRDRTCFREGWHMHLRSDVTGEATSPRR